MTGRVKWIPANGADSTGFGLASDELHRESKTPSTLVIIVRFREILHSLWGI